MEIKIIKWKEFESGTLAGFADISYNGMIVKCRIINGKNGKFVSLPSEKSQKDGKYYPLVKFESQELGNEFNANVLELIFGEEVDTKPDSPEQVDWNE